MNYYEENKQMILSNNNYGEIKMPSDECVG